VVLGPTTRLAGKVCIDGATGRKAISDSEEEKKPYINTATLIPQSIDGLLPLAPC
jgi:hypothetical protein